MPAAQTVERSADEREKTTLTRLRLVRARTAPAFARRHVQRELAAALSAARLSDVVLLTSEVVTNAVEHSRADTLEIVIVRGAAFTRVEVSNPGESWGSGPELRTLDLDEPGGWGLFLVEELSDRWAVSDANRTVWFEFDHPAPPDDVDEVSRELFAHRAESNVAVVGITAEVCERCGFPWTPGDSHSCIEEKARFAESANAVTAEFDKFDESTARQSTSEGPRKGHPLA